MSKSLTSVKVETFYHNSFNVKVIGGFFEIKLLNGSFSIHNLPVHNRSISISQNTIQFYISLNDKCLHMLFSLRL